MAAPRRRPGARRARPRLRSPFRKAAVGATAPRNSQITAAYCSGGQLRLQVEAQCVGAAAPSGQVPASRRGCRPRSRSPSGTGSGPARAAARLKLRGRTPRDQVFGAQMATSGPERTERPPGQTESTSRRHRLAPAARFSGRAGSPADPTRSGEISARPSPKPMSVTRMWSDHRFVTSPTASAPAPPAPRAPGRARRRWPPPSRPDLSEWAVPSDTQAGAWAMARSPGAPPVSAACRGRPWPRTVQPHLAAVGRLPRRGGFGRAGRFTGPGPGAQVVMHVGGVRWSRRTTGGAGWCPACAPRGHPAPSRRVFPASAASGRSGDPAAERPPHAPAACTPARPARRRPAGRGG